ncbi:hypothetical protein EVAR_17301_1 [Eumeta japonica]|uniref:Uncharacterized protein n=1 Tax=Eumeta variegata TaxID=151549 RepID=A0A4C1TT38_EUMVA|nr:hypothetical protein EVAR_17301_1 [Eumeta japonica]
MPQANNSVNSSQDKMISNRDFITVEDQLSERITTSDNEKYLKYHEVNETSNTKFTDDITLYSSEHTTLNHNSLSDKVNILVRNYFKTSQNIESTQSENNRETSTNYTDVTEALSPQPRICDEGWVLNVKEDVCVPRSSLEASVVTKPNTTGLITFRSSFNIPCPPGTGRAADNTCQPRV